MRLRKALDESLDNFHDCFIHLYFEFSKDVIDWNLMKEKFEFLVHISLNLENMNHSKFSQHIMVMELPNLQ